jgi:protein SCO1
MNKTTKARTAAFVFGLFFCGTVLHAVDPEIPSTNSSELPDFTATAVTTEGSKKMGKKDLLGQVWVADFIFTTCGDICPRMTRQMRRLQNRLPPEVLLVSFTIDPKRDTVDVLQSFAKEFEADPKRWFFLRMSEKKLGKLMDSGFKLVTTDRATFEKNVNDQLNHNSRFVVMDKRGRIRGYYDGLQEESLGFVVAAAKKLQEEK